MKRHAPATKRNRDPIATVLSEELPASGIVLEVASGTGELAVYFAERFPDHRWQPSDPDPAALQSIASWTPAITSRVGRLIVIHGMHWTESFDAPTQPVFVGGAPGPVEQGR